ncbi:MAG: DUF2232 domain-containing protein [Gemmatimonas sp.]|jgi:hypothetical protein|uniref:DUF2232 domain-containing protein n=1 Tax=Gemmatimonas sp. TaxID=1962908 RepID=UPI00391F3DF7
MDGVVASGPAATAPRERGWRWFVLALVLMVLVTSAPAWPPPLALLAGAIRLLLPVEQFALLVLVAIASCGIVGWWSGGRLLLGLVWVAAAAYVVWRVPLPLTGYGAFLRGWAVTVGAAFGLVCLASPSRPFLSRGLAAIALAGGVTLVGFATRAVDGASASAAAEQMLSREYQQRLGAALDAWRSRSTSTTWREFSRRVPEAMDRANRLEAVLVALGEPVTASDAVGGSRAGPLVRLAPALLALESLAALALGWAAYHRLTRSRIGPPLGALRDLRFNDQCVWGLVVGITVLLLPTLVEWRTVGLNLLCFFGTLYALRGAGVLTWWVPDRIAGWALLALLVLVPILGPMWVLVTVLAITFSLGLGDTWRDFRAGAAPRRPSSP